MTPEQIATLRTTLLSEANPSIAAAVVARNDTETARLLNLPSASIVWRSLVSQDEITQNGFDWVRVDNLTPGKARIWEWMFANEQRAINPRKDNVRAGIAECWKGIAADIAVREVVLGHCRRAATQGERYFMTGTGTTAAPALLSFEGVFSIDHVGKALSI